MNRVQRFRGILMSIMIIALYFIWPYFVNVVLRLFELNEDIVLYIRFFSNFVLLGIFISLYYDDLRKALRNYKKDFKKDTLIGMKSILIGIVVMVLLNIIIITLLPNVPQANENQLMVGFKSIRALFALNVLVYYPISEELVFKKTFKDVIDNKWFFILFTAFINSFFNIAFTATETMSYIYILPSIAIGASYSYIYYKTDNIGVSILFRILYNLIPTLLFVFGL